MTVLSGVGSKRAEQFEKLGVCSVGELINFYPRAYEDWTSVTAIADITEEGVYCVKARLATSISDAMIGGGRIAQGCLFQQPLYQPDVGLWRRIFLLRKNHL